MPHGRPDPEHRADETQLSVVVPTRNERANIAELVRRIELMAQTDATLSAERVEVLFVDDSTDDTPAVVATTARSSSLRVRCLHRGHATGGLAGAVMEGLRIAESDTCVVIDGDLQHPPELIGELYASLAQGSDIVVASRYAGGGSATGLAGRLRRGVSTLSTTLVKSLFPVRLSSVSDPMSGYFACNRARVDVTGLRPRGFKILLEILASDRFRIDEVPFAFASRGEGDSKATVRQGREFLAQLFRLRFGKLSGFAVVGAVGAIVNVALVWLFTRLGLGVVPSTLLAAEITIVGNFLVADRFVFGDLRAESHGFWRRFARSFIFNNVEAAVRIWLVVVITGAGWMSPAAATAVLLGIVFVIRYVFHALVVYAPRR